MRKQSENLLAILKSAVHHEALSLNANFACELH